MEVLVTSELEQELEQIADSLDPLNLDWLAVVIAIAVFVASVLLAGVARRAIRSVSLRLDSGSHAVFNAAARFASWLIIFLGFVIAMRVLGIDFVPLLTGLGVIAVILTVALRPFFENFAAGITLQLQRPIELGDDVSIAGTEGEVEELTARTVVLRTMDGTRVHLPNRTVIDSAIENLTDRRLRRTTVNVGLAYGTDLAAASAIMVEAARTTPGVSAHPKPEALIHEFADSTIDAAVRYWHDSTINSGWTARHEVAVHIKRALDDNGIEIAFPQRVLWNGEDGEGSPLSLQKD